MCVFSVPFSRDQHSPLLDIWQIFWNLNVSFEASQRIAGAEGIICRKKYICEHPLSGWDVFLSSLKITIGKNLVNSKTFLKNAPGENILLAWCSVRQKLRLHNWGNYKHLKGYYQADLCGNNHQENALKDFNDILSSAEGLWKQKESLSIPLETLYHHIAISCLSLIWSNLKLHSSEASHSSLCSPTAIPSLALFLTIFSFHFCSFMPSLSLSPSRPACLCNVMISMLRIGKALRGYQSLRQPVSSFTVSQEVDQFSPSPHTVVELLIQFLGWSLNHLVIFFFLPIPVLSLLLCFYIFVVAAPAVVVFAHLLFMRKLYRNRCIRRNM